MSAISWNEAAPSDDTTASLVDNAIRSMQSNIAGGLGQELYWPGSGGGSAASAGEAKPGMLKFARTSAVTGGHPDGFLSIDPLRVALHHIGSTWTGMLGHARMLDHSRSNVTVDDGWKVGGRWVVQEGSFATSRATGDFAIAFPTAYAARPPFIALTSTSTSVTANPRHDFSATTFNSCWSAWVASPSTFTINWMSEGTIAF